MANHLVASAAIGSAGNETALVRRAQAGDSVAFEALVEERLGRTYRLAKAVVGDPWAAEDVAQEAFIQAWRNLPHLRDPDRFDAWFGRIVVNAARMQLRRRRPVISVSIDALNRGDSGRGEPDPALEAVADADALRRAIDRLGIDQRTILALQYVEDRPVEEIAAILGIPTGTAKWRLSRSARGVGTRDGDPAMSKATIDEREIEAAFLARAAGSPSPELQQRITVTVRATRQRRPLLAWPWPLQPGSARLAWVAILAATAMALLGLLAVAGGWQPRLLATPPTAQPSGSPKSSPSAPAAPSSASPSPGASPVATSRTLEARFLSDDGILVTIDITDRSGRLVEAIKGQEGLITEPSAGNVWMANPPGEPTTLRVEWFSPAGCHEHYGMTIDAALRTITMHASYVEGGDSIGGNCGVTLRFATEVPASAIEGVLDNVPPIFGAGSLALNEVARVIVTDGLRVRSAPGIGAGSQRLEPLLPAGARLFVLEGPVTADGYAWYRITPCRGQPAYPAGWVAVASRLGEPWVERASGLECPSP